MDWQAWLFQVSWVTLQNRLCGTCSGPRFPPGMKEWLQSLGQRRKPKLPVPKACSPREPVSPDSSPPRMIMESVRDRGSWRGGERGDRDTERKGVAVGLARAEVLKPQQYRQPPGVCIKTECWAPASELLIQGVQGGA